MNHAIFSSAVILAVILVLGMNSASRTIAFRVVSSQRPRQQQLGACRRRQRQYVTSRPVPFLLGNVVPAASTAVAMLARQRTQRLVVSAGTVRHFAAAAEDDSGRGDDDDADEISSPFKPGDKIQIEVISFGPLGASVEVIGDSHDPDCLVPESDPPLAQGLVLQKEIRYFREARGNVDVVRGEVLPAFVERVRDDGKIDIALRPVGGKAKAQEVGAMILDRLRQREDDEPGGGVLAVGDKSTPEEVAREFPGTSKGAFKKALSSLYRQKLVKPGPHSVTLLPGKNQ